MDDQDNPRPMAPTPAGAGPSSAPRVVGAVARPHAPRPTEVTLPMIFEPLSDADSHIGSPPLATVAPEPLVPAAARAAEGTGVGGTRLRKRWLALGALALGAAVAVLRVGRSESHSGAAPSPPPTAVTAAAIASATATGLAPPFGSSDPPVAETSAPTRVAAARFDAVAAKKALDATTSAVARCQKGQVLGGGHAIVTFGNDGTVHRCAVSPPFLGTSAGMCVAKTLSQARVPAFVGDLGVVVHHFFVAAQ